ncbi:YbaB/EbfC family nucleoid-associated protein [Actinophytocola gossypii]|uniref:YbaB/EbfC family nucleoid-associated protein n=1 Tax=Actinophytocola gossypii TaxID=2812003 RepID=A0ABT2JH38_9PSEU|nr:YbaB/EbfC family nucleoid-associated protein [Actinophytocola gossypii]MCT2586735.1 YbaB/EbfC family nucleoid-associated protein [Actinophytocola gossypii]
MNPLIDLERRVNEIAAQTAREYLDTQRSRPGATGRSPDGTVEVTVNGLGDVSDVRVHARDVPPEVAARLADAMKAAWNTAARAHAVAETDNPLANQPGFAELVEEQINERYGPPPEPENPQQAATPGTRPAARPRGTEDEEENFGATSIMQRVRGE